VYSLTAAAGGEARCQLRHASRIRLTHAVGNAAPVSCNRTPGSPPARAGRRRSVGLRARPMLDRRHVPDRPPTPSHLRAVRLAHQPSSSERLTPPLTSTFHAARSTCLPGPPWRIYPDVHPLHKLLCQQHIVVTQEDEWGRVSGPADELYPCMDQCLPALSPDGTLPAMMSCTRRWGMVNRRSNRVRVVQVRGSVSCRLRTGARSPESMHRDQTGVSLLQLPLPMRLRRSVAVIIVHGHTSTRDLLRRLRNCQSLASETRRIFSARVSVVPNQRSFPQASVQRSSAGAGVPGGHVDPVRHVSDWNFVRGATEDNRGSNRCPADFPCRRLTPLDGPTPPDCQIGHVEISLTSHPVLAAKGQANRGLQCQASPGHTRQGIAR